MTKYENILNTIKNTRDCSLEMDCEIVDRTAIISIIKTVQVLFYPCYYHYQDLNEDSAMERLEELLNSEVEKALKYKQTTTTKEEIVDGFMNQLPSLYEVLSTDLQAIYDGDPAASTKDEIILCYPGFYAIFIYRLAHALRDLSTPLIPRIMTEYAHEKTGIDINPGATIGHHFCIDHGTGIVIGETAILGDHVKLYQGVTIGAKSFENDENGNPIKGGKRHPNIGNHVIVYANATILGGNTSIGDNCIIGGNAWITSSVEANQTIYNKD